MDADKEQQVIERIRLNKQRFYSYNRAKLSNLYSAIGNPHTIELLETIPYFLSVNQPEIPGYVRMTRVPVGMHGFEPSPRALNFLKNRFPSARVTTRFDSPVFIQMLALMGSSGTIAYTDNSDFDFWVCADESGFDPAGVKFFKMKCRILENWIAEHFNLECHFFLNDIKKVKRNIFDEDTEVDMGATSLGELLKEEFFRSSIVLHGKVPFWWLIPAGADDRIYEGWLQLAAKNTMADQFIDLGNLYKINREDYLVAALFQILKSLGNPFKSIIKLGLLERYLSAGIDNPFISSIIKKNVQDSDLSTDSIDAYVIMFNHVYDYYGKVLKDSEISQILESCFYLKVDPKLSRFIGKGAAEIKSEKTRKMLDFVSHWNWSESSVLQLDDFENWDIDSVNKLLSNTKKYMLRGYKSILSNIEARKVPHKITDEDLKVITRKIYSHFAISENKVDNTLSFKSYPPEKLLTIEFIRDKDGNEYWILSKRIIVKEYPTKVIIHKEKNQMSLIVWIALNHLFQKNFTRVEISAGIHAVDPNFLRELLSDLSMRFSYRQVELHGGYFKKEPFPLASYIIINPYTKYAKKIDDIIYLYHNSWGETRFERFKGEMDIAQILARAINGGLVTRKDALSALNMIASHPYYASREFDRLKFLLSDVYSFFIEQQEEGRRRYITMLGNQFVVFSTKRTPKDETVICSPFDSEARMLYSISYNTGARNIIKTDPTIPELNYLKTIIENHRDKAVQIYFQKETKYCYFFVCDERGGVIFFRKNAASLSRYLASLYLFAQNAVKVATKVNQDSTLKDNLKQIEMYQLERDIKNNCRIVEVNPELDANIIDMKKNLQPVSVSVHRQASGEMGYRLKLPDGTDTEVCGQAGLQKIAAHMLTLMKKDRMYGYYVTEMDLAQAGNRAFSFFTSYAFTEKNRFEMMIESLLKV